MDFYPYYTNVFYWMPYSFELLPHWRMLRASYRIDNRQQPNERYDDRWVEIAIKFLDSRRYAKLVPSIQQAHQIWIAATDQRWLLEAQLLTSRSDADISKILAISTSVVRAYHALFFDVRNRLQASDWIMMRAIRSEPMLELIEPQRAFIWKHFAYHGGPHILDLVVAVMRGQALPESSFKNRNGTNAKLEEMRSRILVRLSIMALTADTDQQFSHLVELKTHLDALDIAAGHDVQEDRRLLKAMGQILKLSAKAAKTANDPVSSQPEPRCLQPDPIQHPPATEETSNAARSKKGRSSTAKTQRSEGTERSKRARGTTRPKPG